jgi:hypothetical protein
VKNELMTPLRTKEMKLDADLLRPSFRRAREQGKSGRGLAGLFAFRERVDWTMCLSLAVHTKKNRRLLIHGFHHVFDGVQKSAFRDTTGCRAGVNALKSEFVEIT